MGLQIIYEGNQKWHLRFDSGTEVILTTEEIEQIVAQYEDALYKKCSTKNICKEEK